MSKNAQPAGANGGPQGDWLDEMIPNSIVPQHRPVDLTALILWEHLFGLQFGFLYLFSVQHEHGTKTPVADTGLRAIYKYPDRETAAHWWSHQESKGGRDAYFTAHLLRSRPRRWKRGGKGHAGPVLALWSDLEDTPIPTDTAEALNRRLNVAIGVTGGWQLSKPLRVPGTVNYTQPGLTTVRLVQCEFTREFDPSELDRLLPALPDVSTDESTRSEAER
jgi:hypothetical protein